MLILTNSFDRFGGDLACICASHTQYCLLFHTNRDSGLCVLYSTTYICTCHYSPIHAHHRLRCIQFKPNRSTYFRYILHVKLYGIFECILFITHCIWRQKKREHESKTIHKIHQRNYHKRIKLNDGGGSNSGSGGGSGCGTR